ncbi:chondroitin sulfate synthase 2 [Caerostris extrusa]|uniref:Hexosyltransferase n=1 Tax=Caerostris extrusa TaxID=172846 RepID=A0AAV4XXG2_CAEEX|nr:chondroitin sulfate synthase 2 [Caerostris extrusa]
MRIFKRLKFYFSHQILPILGVCVGITLSLIIMPLVEENCLNHRDLSSVNSELTQLISVTTVLAADDYEPVLYLNTKPKNAPRPGKIQIPRARYYSTELNIKEKLFIGILSTPQSIYPMGSALNRTLSKHIDKIMFFLEGTETENIDLSIGSIVGFPDKREILGPFNMLQYIAENYLNEYDFFFLHKDTTHIRGKKLLEFVSHISITQNVHLGRPLGIDSFYCDLDAGILLSHSVLSKVVKDLDWCIQHTFSQSNSDNFGRCILHGTDQPCQNSIQSLNYESHQISNKTSWPVGIEPPFKPHGRFDVLPWIYFNTTHNFLQTEIDVISELKGLYKVEIQDLLKCTVQWMKTTHNDKFIYQKLVNGYKRFDPTRGTEYILDMLFLEETSGQEILKRINAVRPLNEVEIVPVPFVTEHTRVVLLVIVKASERNEALRFLEDYAKACIEKQDSTVMLLVFLYGPQDPGKGEKEDVFGPVKDLVNSLVNKYRSNGAKIAWFSVKTIGKMPPYFAIIDLISRKLSSESLLLLCHVGMEVRPDYINRVRMNTILKTQVFFPIPFRQYHPSLAYNHITVPDNVEVKKDLGHFDTDSFEHASFYLADYLAARKQLESTISMIKLDKDLKNEYLYSIHFDLFEIFLQSKLHVMRAVEPDLRIRFKFDLCDLESSVTTYQECLHNREQNLGTKSQMAAEVLSHSDHGSKENINFNGIL